MTTVTAAAPELVRRLLLHEAGESHSPQAMVEAAERACEKLRVHLTKRVGRDGFHVLLVRALTLSVAQFPYLSTVRAQPDGTLDGLRFAAFSGPQEPDNQAHEQEEAAGAVALVEHLVGLLITFIGEDLTLRLLVTIWPTL